MSPCQIAAILYIDYLSRNGTIERRIIHDSTFSVQPDGEGARRPSVNKTTYWDQIADSYLADVMLQIVWKMLGLRNRFGRGRKID